MVFLFDVTVRGFLHVLPQVSDTSLYFRLIKDVIKDNEPIPVIEGAYGCRVKVIDVESLSVAIWVEGEFVSDAVSGWLHVIDKE